MRKAQVLAIFAVMVFPTIGFAQSLQTKAEPVPTTQRVLPPPPAYVVPYGVLRQDLFDRNNPNNLRSDYHAPPAQPAQH